MSSNTMSTKTSKDNVSIDKVSNNIVHNVIVSQHNGSKDTAAMAEHIMSAKTYYN